MSAQCDCCELGRAQRRFEGGRLPVVDADARVRQVRTRRTWASCRAARCWARARRSCSASCRCCCARCCCWSRRCAACTCWCGRSSASGHLDGAGSLPPRHGRPGAGQPCSCRTKLTWACFSRGAISYGQSGAIPSCMPCRWRARRRRWRRAPPRPRTAPHCASGRPARPTHRWSASQRTRCAPTCLAWCTCVCAHVVAPMGVPRDHLAAVRHPGGRGGMSACACCARADHRAATSQYRPGLCAKGSLVVCCDNGAAVSMADHALQLSLSY